MDNSESCHHPVEVVTFPFTSLSIQLSIFSTGMDKISVTEWTPHLS